MERRQRDFAFPKLAGRSWLYAITDGSGTGILDQAHAAVAAGADAVQIREPRLSAASLYQAGCHLRASLAGSGVRVLVSDRWDVALAAGLDGVHLPGRGLPAAAVRPASRPGFLIGCSCHSPEEVAVAASFADFCVLGPIFATPSKQQFGAPLGPAALAAAAGCGVPVLALGGVTWDNGSECLRQGAAGLAGIRLFRTPRPASA